MVTHFVKTLIAFRLTITHCYALVCLNTDSLAQIAHAPKKGLLNVKSSQLVTAWGRIKTLTGLFLHQRPVGCVIPRVFLFDLEETVVFYGPGAWQDACLENDSSNIESWLPRGNIVRHLSRSATAATADDSAASGDCSSRLAVLTTVPALAPLEAGLQDAGGAIKGAQREPAVTLVLDERPFVVWDLAGL